MADCKERLLASLKPEDVARYKSAAEALVNKLSAAKKQAMLDGLLNPESAYREKAKEIIDRMRTDMAVERLKAQENLVKRATRDQKYAAFPDKEQGMQAQLTGDYRRVGGERDSVAGRQEAIKGVLQSRLDSLFDDADRKIATSGEIDRNIRVELSELNKKDGKPGLTKDADALRIAKKYQELDKTILGVLNTAGAHISELDGWAGRMTHDSEAIGKVGFDKWFEDVMPKLDGDKTFRGGLIDQDPKKFLKSVYDDIISGKSSRGIGDTTGSDQLYRTLDTPANLANRAERSRVLFFKDAGAEHDYLQDYGKNHNMAEERVSAMRRASRDAGLMQVFGTNPGAAMEGDFKRLGVGENNAMRADAVKNRMAEVMGDTLRPAENMPAKVAANARALESMSKLGYYLSNIPSHLFLKTNALMNARGGGVSTLAGSLMDTISTTISGLPSGVRGDVARATGVGMNAFHQGLLTEMGAEAAGVGKMSRALNLYAKWGNFMDPVLSTMKETAAHVSAWELGLHAGKDYSALPESIVNNLKRYNIGEGEWKMLSQMGETAKNGERYVSLKNLFEPDSAKMLDHAKAAGVIPDGASSSRAGQLAEKFRYETATKLGNYYNDQAGIAMTEPDANTRSILLRGTNQNTMSGIVLRLLTQFKAFPVSVMTRNIADTMYANGAMNMGEAVNPLSGKSNLGGLGTMAATLGTAGIVGNWISDVLHNKEPRKLDGKAVTEGLVKGGTLGLMGDYILGDYNKRYGRDALASVAGPTLGQFGDVEDLWSKMKGYGAGEEKFPRAALQRLVMNNAPIPFYARTAFEQSFLYHFNNQMNPGYMNRMEARMRKQGQHFIVPPRR